MNETTKTNMNGPNANMADLNSLRETELNDGLIRLLVIPAFGILIPNATDLFHGVLLFSGQYWMGYLLFLSLSFLIWHGNRWFLIKQRIFYDWFRHATRKLVLLVFANVFFTAPITVIVLWAWYRFVNVEVNWTTIEVVCLINVICVMFVTHVYETVYLIKQRENDLLRLERLHRMQVEAELMALKNQLDPHFVFNSLNTLSQLIDEQTHQAQAFTEHLADVYRYILASHNRSWVPLNDELRFVRSYLALLRIRFGDGLVMKLPDIETDQLLIMPISLQVLVENAVKHNQFNERSPLLLECRIESEHLVVDHAKFPKRDEGVGTGIGLKNLNERALILTGRGITVVDDERFSVEIPLMRLAS